MNKTPAAVPVDADSTGTAWATMMQKRRYDLALLFRMWTEGVHADEIAKALGCGPDQVHKLRREHHLPKRPRPEKPTIDPTPDEIRDRAAYCRMMRERGTPIGGI